MNLDLSIEGVQWDFTLKALIVITMPIYNYRLNWRLSNRAWALIQCMCLFLHNAQNE